MKTPETPKEFARYLWTEVQLLEECEAAIDARDAIRAAAMTAEIERLRKIETAARTTVKWARKFAEERGCEGDTPDGSCPDYKEVVDDWCDVCRVWRGVEALDAALAEESKP